MDHREKDLLTPVQFAESKGVLKAAVYSHIDKGLIIPTYIGKHKTVFIDADYYKDYTFDKRRANNTKKS